jgi:hypothetical protein
MNNNIFFSLPSSDIDTIEIRSDEDEGGIMKSRRNCQSANKA